MVETLKIYLNNLSNRDLIKFDEKYIKLIFYCIAMNMNSILNKIRNGSKQKLPRHIASTKRQ